jgi:hypothetical protein
MEEYSFGGEIGGSVIACDFLCAATTNCPDLNISFCDNANPFVAKRDMLDVKG